MEKRVLTILFFCFSLIVLISQSLYSSNDKILLHGYDNLFDVEEIAEKLGYNILYNPITGWITLTNERHKIVMIEGVDLALVDTQLVLLPSPPLFLSNHIFISQLLLDKILEIEPIDYIEVTNISISNLYISNTNITNYTNEEIEEIQLTDASSSLIDTIFIDPGHGGKDTGALAYEKKTKEKDLALKMSLILKEELKKHIPNVNVVLTREEDEYLSLKQRVDKVNKTGNSGIFISVHYNSSRNKKRNGYEVYYLSPNATDSDARLAMLFENGYIPIEEVKEIEALGGILSKLASEELMRESMLLAQIVYEYSMFHIEKFGIKGNGYKGAPFYVLKYTKHPSILVECGYISNPEEFKKVSEEDYMRALAKGISLGIRRFIEIYNKTQGFTKPLVEQ